MKKIWLSSPHMGGREMKYVNEAFRDNWVAPLGPNVNGFEEDLEKFLGGGSHAAALSSGTGALHLALVLLGVGCGDSVICQSLTFTASANPIKYLHANPVFVDSEKDTWNLCPDAVETAIKNLDKKGIRPKAIIAVDLYGMPYKADEIKSISDRYEIPVIEDAAEALGSSYKGRKCGTLSDTAVISFNGNKIITTSGGGALIFKKRDSKAKAVFLSTQAKDEAPHYEHSSLGYNYRMSNICAGIGRGQMEVLPERILERRAHNLFYQKLFAGVPGVTVFTEPSEDYYSNYWLTSLLIDEAAAGFSREDLRTAMAAEDIESRPIWKPMHMQPIYSKDPFYGGTVSEKIFQDGLCMPSGSNMTPDESMRIESAVQEFLQKISIAT